MKLLSILTATIPARAEKFNQLSVELNRQMEVLHERNRHRYLEQDCDKEVELLANDSPSFLDGGLSIGKKREALRDRATGKYICYLDDDEGIAPNYLEVLYDLCKQDKDVCTFMNISKLERFWCVIDMSLNYKENKQARPGIVKRPPWHICPVRREYGLLHPFPDSNYGEDWTWFEQVLTHCKTQARNRVIIHQYNHKEKSEADRANEI